MPAHRIHLYDTSVGVPIQERSLTECGRPTRIRPGLVAKMPAEDYTRLAVDLFDGVCGTCRDAANRRAARRAHRDVERPGKVKRAGVSSSPPSGILQRPREDAGAETPPGAAGPLHGDATL